MWIPKNAALIRGQRLFEAQHLLEEIRCTENFLLHCICENRYTLSMRKKPYFPKINIQKKKHAQKCWLIQLFLELINNNSFSIVTCLSFR